MYILDGKGYQPSSAEELRQQLIEDLKKYNIPFLSYPQTIQGALNDQASVYLMYPELLISDLLNSFSFTQANETILDLMGADRGIRRKGAYKAEVTLRFTGSLGVVIPKDLQVSDPDGNVVFQTFEDTLINTSTGIVDVLAYTDSTSFSQIGIGALTKIVSNIPNLSVTNIDTPTEPVEAESNEQYRLRVLQRMRNGKGSSIGSVLSAILEIEGVDTRLVSWRRGEVEVQGVKYRSFEVVVGGGSPTDIAYAMYQWGGINSALFLSNPSNSETTRTVSQNIQVFNQVDTYQFTRPKKLTLDISVRVALKNIEVENASIEAKTQDSMNSYINSLQVGTLINVMSLTDAFMKGFREAKGTALNINAPQITFTINANGSPLNVDSYGYYPIEFDEYCVLGKYSVVVNA